MCTLGEEPHATVVKKLPDALTNPLDRIICAQTARALPAMHAWGQTPNMITTYSFVTGLLAVVALAMNHLALFATLYFVSYLFDCMDGQLARKYNMCSEWGDRYDHRTDVVVFLPARGCMVPDAPPWPR